MDFIKKTRVVMVVGQKVCDKINNRIRWGIIVEKNGSKCLIKWGNDEYRSYHGWAEEYDLIPEGDPIVDLKELL